MKDKSDTKTQELPLDDYYIVYYKGKPTLRLNARLIIQKELSRDTVENIKSLHLERLTIEEGMKNTTSNARLKYLYAEWVENQMMLQKKWGFPEDINHFRFWELPQCKCPKLDNYDSYPSGYYTINQDCPIHGNS